MSIIQVMDSTKSGRVIYVVAASLIVIGTAIAYFQFLGQESNLTLESGVGYLPFIGLFSILLWITQPDRGITEHDIIKYIYKGNELANIRVRMASALLYVMPWESSPQNALSIEESLRKDLERTLRSPELKDQIDNYKQAFWLILLTPFSLVMIVAFYPIPALLMAIIGFGLGCFLAWLLLRENQLTLARIVEYAFARWFHEDTSTDLSRRKSGFGKKSDVKERLEATLEIVTPTIDLAVRGDWRGFDRKSRTLEQLIGTPKSECLSWNLLNDFIRFLQWCVGEIHGPNSQRVDICLQNGELQITDSINLLRENRTPSFNEEENTIASVMNHLVRYSSSCDALLNLSAEFYNIFDDEIFKKMTDLSYDILKKIPFNLNKLEPPKWSGSLTNPEQLAYCLVAAAEQKLFDMKIILKIISSWKVLPIMIQGTLGVICAKT